jgi:hypothetical protein
LKENKGSSIWASEVENLRRPEMIIDDPLRHSGKGQQFSFILTNVKNKQNCWSLYT